MKSVEKGKMVHHKKAPGDVGSDANFETPNFW